MGASGLACSLTVVPAHIPEFRVAVPGASSAAAAGVGLDQHIFRISELLLPLLVKPAKPVQSLSSRAAAGWGFVYDRRNAAGGPPNFNFAAGGNPYFGQHPKKTDPTTYLAGGTDFGPALSGPGYLGSDIISRNLTPDKTGMPGHTLAQFMQILRTGVDLDHLHPTWTSTSPPTPVNCIPAPVDGALLQIMAYLSAIPCIAGPPAPSPLHNDCK